MADNEKSVYDVSRQAFDAAKVAEVATACGIAVDDTKLEIKNDKGEVVKTVEFKKVLFEKPTSDEDTPEDRLSRLVAFFEALQPSVEKDGKVERLNNPLDIAASHVSYSFDLTMRNGIRSKEKVAIEGPDKEILKQAKKLAAYKGISEAEAIEKVKAAWGVE